MRPSVLIFGVLVLALCVVILRESHVGRVRPNAAAMPEKRLESPALVPAVGVERVPEVMPVQAAQVTSWESQFEELASQPEWLQSQEELEELANHIPRDSLRTALEELLNHESAAAIVMTRRLAVRWAGEQPEAAGQWATGLPDDDFGRAVCREIAASWAQTNLVGAVEWIRQQPDGGKKTAAEFALSQAAASGEHPVAAIDLLAELPPGLERNSLLNYSVRQWANLDRDDAVSWVGQISDESLRTRLLKNVAMDWAVASPAAAAGLVATRLPAGDEQKEAVTDVVRSWAVSAPDQAAAWVTQFPEGDLKQVAFTNLMAVWDKTAPVQAQGNQGNPGQ